MHLQKVMVEFIVKQKGCLLRTCNLLIMEASGIDVFRTARNNAFEVDTRKETYGRWNYFVFTTML